MTDFDTDYRLLTASRDPLTADTVAPYQIHALRTVAFSIGDERLADDCTVAIGVAGQADEEAAPALLRCVGEINRIRAQLGWIDRDHAIEASARGRSTPAAYELEDGSWAAAHDGTVDEHGGRHHWATLRDGRLVQVEHGSTPGTWRVRQ